ncbi:hypothetical protein ACFYW8_04495 [Streptomyces sp. NPDC002742]|uniref:hypothetical protein n=1 Tax=Streptomyces sp. NPDC002742 TaxID=3364663 RepID=UPI0036958651
MSVSQTPHKFGASTTAAEVIDGVDLHGRRAVVTGASSGIGVETARVLAAAGAATPCSPSVPPDDGPTTASPPTR